MYQQFYYIIRRKGYPNLTNAIMSPVNLTNAKTLLELMYKTLFKLIYKTIMPYPNTLNLEPLIRTIYYRFFKSGEGYNILDCMNNNI